MIIIGLVWWLIARRRSRQRAAAEAAQGPMTYATQQSNYDPNQPAGSYPSYGQQQPQGQYPFQGYSAQQVPAPVGPPAPAYNAYPGTEKV